MASKNDITGDSIQTKVASDLYKQNYEKIFGKSKLELKLEQERQDQKLEELMRRFKEDNDLVKVPDEIKNEKEFYEWIQNSKTGNK